MKKIISTLLASCCLTSLIAQEVVVKGPDEKLQLVVSASPAEKPSYSITYNGKTMLEKSPLGMNTNIGDFVKGMKLTGHAVTPIDTVYHQDRIKTSKVHYQANELICNFENPKGQKIDVVFHVSNHDVAFRYTLPRQGWKRKCNGNCRRNRLSLSATNNYFLMSAKRCHDRLEAYQTQL